MFMGMQRVEEFLLAPPLVATWARGRLAQLANAGRWGTDPHATVAVARSIYGHLPKGGTPLWLGISNVGHGDPAAVLAALADASGPTGP